MSEARFKYMCSREKKNTMKSSSIVLMTDKYIRYTIIGFALPLDLRGTFYTWFLYAVNNHSNYAIHFIRDFSYIILIYANIFFF